MEYTVKDLQEFEQWVIDEYHKGNIRSPVHLSGSEDNQQELHLIAIFKKIKPQDWVFCTYRSHYMALLKGVNKEWLKDWILKNRSMHVMSEEHNLVTTAIVASQLSQAVGCAIAIKRNGGTDHVWAFCGDACAEMGVFHEMTKFARRNNLPITFVVEDNGYSTDTNTQDSWGREDGGPNIIRYTYKRINPHYGSPRGRVDFT